MICLLGSHQGRVERGHVHLQESRWCRAFLLKTLAFSSLASTFPSQVTHGHTPHLMIFYQVCSLDLLPVRIQILRSCPQLIESKSLKWGPKVYMFFINFYWNKGSPGGSDSKESAFNAGDPGSILGPGSSFGEGNTTHSSILAWRIPWPENSMARGAWRATVHGVAKSQTRLKLLSIYLSSICVCSVTHLCLTLCEPVDCSSTGFSVLGFPRQGYWTISSCRGSSWLKEGTHISWVSCIGRWILDHGTTWEALIYLLNIIYLSSPTGSVSLENSD